MKISKCFVSMALVLSMLLCILSGCSSGASGKSPRPSRPKLTTRFEPALSQPEKVAETTASTELTQPLETTSLSQPIPKLTTLTALRDYMNTQVDSGTLDFSFYYTRGGLLTARQLAQILNCCYIECSWEGNLYHVTVTEYPGDRMVDAWINANRSGLTETESQVLDYALDLVQNWTADTSDPWELELLVHDFLAEHILYTDANVDFDGANNVPRELTAIGALQDGRANCQGYVDAFYLLATLAGLQVDRMSVQAPYGGHMVNTVLLDDQWYIVDVTYDDMDEASSLNYYLFNVGTDRIREYSWTPEMEYRPIADKTDDAFYYAHQGTLFDNPQTAASYVAQNWGGGEACFQFAVQGQAEDQPMNDALYDALMDTGNPFYYTYWYYSDGTDMYFTLFLE